MATISKEMLINDNCRKMASPVIVELIDNCNIDDLKCIKDKSEEDIEKIVKGFKIIREEFLKNNK